MIYFAQYKNKKFNPLSDDDYRKSLKLKEGDFLKIETWKERNILFHRKYFALLNCTINHLPEDEVYDQYRDMEFLRKYIMIIIGKCDVIIGLTGKENYIPKSISFQKMDEIEFQDVYSKSIDAILKYFLKHISLEDFENDILNFL